MKQPAPLESLSAAQARREHARLGEEIAAHDRRYYTEDAPTISDAEYDALRQRYEALEAAFPELATPESLTKKVGAAPSEKFAKVRHRVPMLSLGNIFADEEVAEFAARVRRFLGLGPDAPLAITAEPKIDGLSCSLRYESGAARPGGNARRWLRGRGRHRQCPHHRRNSARRSKAQPPDILEVRGEVYMTHADFAALNARQKEAGKTVFRQSAQCGGGLAAPARSRDHRVTASAFFRLCLGRGQRPARLDTNGHDRGLQRFRASRQSADGALPFGGGAHRAIPADRIAARVARLRHRRRRL